ncbi:MAG: Protease HtpX [Phycisphaerae bacterium]|nr:Protease HtpX [Phycisphaerae bacterium]
MLFFRRESAWADNAGAGSSWILALFSAGAYVMIALAGSVASTRLAFARMRNKPDQLSEVGRRHHHHVDLIRGYLVAGFAMLFYLSPWGRQVYAIELGPWAKIVADVIVVAPYLAAAVLVWAATYPVDRAFREHAAGPGESLAADGGMPSRRAFVFYNLRFHVLIVALPMLAILFASNAARGYGGTLRRWLFGWPIAPDVVVGAVAMIVFLLSPLLMRRVWTVVPMPAGSLRDRLERMCERIGLGCRGIMIWKSDGMMINAAVMGVVRPVRYILLSDGLLESMNDRQVEAVLGHEAGHVKRRHIEYFLLFALVATLAVSGVAEAALHLFPAMSAGAVEAVGGAATLVIWGLGFGFISRRFEREADLFGAASIAPDLDTCTLPCRVHSDTAVGRHDDVADDREGPCATAANVFVSALDRVAVLNGLDPEEPSWRHSSIASRMRHLTGLAADPAMARRFRRRLSRIRAALIVLSVLGSAASAAYVAWGDPMLLRGGAATNVESERSLADRTGAARR